MDMKLSYDSVDELETALRRAAAAHGEHEARTGVADAEWPVWYALYMQQEQGGPGPEPDA
ncbi:MAG: glyoxalase [Conexibacter sp.]|nr:glyoxalase [Conexibacter sp.]